MDALEVVVRAKAAGLTFTIADDGTLGIDGPIKTATPELMGLIRQYKTAILALFRMQAQQDEAIEKWSGDTGEIANPFAWSPFADPRADLISDSALWVSLLRSAYLVDGREQDGLYGTLHGLRCSGAGLQVTDKGARLVAGEIDPVVYDSAKSSYLMFHAQTLKKLLGEIRPDTHPMTLDTGAIEDEIRVVVVKIADAEERNQSSLVSLLKAKLAGLRSSLKAAEALAV